MAYEVNFMTLLNILYILQQSIIPLCRIIFAPCFFYTSAWVTAILIISFRSILVKFSSAVVWIVLIAFPWSPVPSAFFQVTVPKDTNYDRHHRHFHIPQLFSSRAHSKYLFSLSLSLCRLSAQSAGAAGYTNCILCKRVRHLQRVSWIRH